MSAPPRCPGPPQGPAQIVRRPSGFRPDRSSQFKRHQDVVHKLSSDLNAAGDAPGLPKAQTLIKLTRWRIYPVDPKRHTTRAVSARVIDSCLQQFDARADPSRVRMDINRVNPERMGERRVRQRINRELAEQPLAVEHAPPFAAREH